MRKYNNTQKFNDGLSIQGQVPIDDRLVFTAWSDLYISDATKLSSKLYGTAYVGMQVAVVEENTATVAILRDDTPYTPGKVLTVDETNFDDYWTTNSRSVGVPILTTSQKNVLISRNNLPENYILIRSTQDEFDGLSGEITNNTYSTAANGTYTNILFQAVRLLQTEVAKMRNAFKYGMYSCTNTEMAMSNVVEELKVTPENEPLWAIEEDGLSYLDSIDFSEANIRINTNSSLLVDNSSKEYYDIIANTDGSVLWNDLDNSEGAFANCEDPKIFMYMTVSNLDFLLNLKSAGQDSVTINNISFASLVKSASGTFNIMILINRKQEKSGLLYGNNYMYVSISDYITNDVIVSGFWDLNDGKLYDTFKDHELDNQYYIMNVYFGNIRLSKLSIYSRYLDFTKFIDETDKVVQPNIPNDSDYRYKVAHITIRSVTDENQLKEIKQYLPNNELIWNEDTNTLWIKTNDKVILIGSSSTDKTDKDDTMSQTELINALKELGIVYESSTGLELEKASFEDITFINTNLSEKYVYSVDSTGELHTSVMPTTTLASRIKEKELYGNSTNPVNPGSTTDNVRGFVAKLLCKENNKDFTQGGAIMNESDRIHIAQFYAPLTTDVESGKIGCSHAFIELENTSTYDFQLDGCYLHFFSLDENGNSTYYNLALSGQIKANSTYLIRGKKYIDFDNSNVFIKVNSFDIEWFSAKDTLMDLSVDSTYKAYGLALTYGDSVNGVKIVPTTKLAYTDANGVYKYADNYIDGIIYSVSTDNIPEANKAWAIYNSGYNVQSNSLFRETFLLDPSKQGFQALQSACKDTSRARHGKDTDFTMLSLANEFIEFPKTSLVKAVSDFTPKASYENKTVITEKSNIDLNKPNMITSAFGINILTTRCFNWISGGIFDEFIWIRPQGTTEWSCRYESYNSGKTGVVTEKSDTNITKKSFVESVRKVIYDRITGVFPGTTTEYTAHKVIVNLPTPASNPVIYEYCVGRSLLNGQPDPLHSNVDDLYTVTMYPSSYEPKVYQITDQLGFHWIEYQVWSAAAEKLNDYINDTKGTNIPVLMNTGDMTQSGSRISEWFDYYESGKTLFRHLEQMNVVGNNDLANINPKILGTGDDNGKSNPYYFHVFYCYEVDDFGGTAYPIVKNKYIPSLYYFGNNNYRFIMINSEITTTCCNNWFDISGYNIYTGYTVASANNTYKTETWTPIYDRLFAIMDNFTGKQFITACHEMPFTVITKANIKKNDSTLIAQRSASGTSLVGSHLNSISASDTGYGFNWFSRLLEYFAAEGKTKLCIGGHKHTYAMTFPIRENYTYNDGTVKDSKSGPMTMTTTLNNAVERTVTWTKTMYYNSNTNTFTDTASSQTEKYTYETWKALDLNKNDATKTESVFNALSDSEKSVKYNVNTSKLPYITTDVYNYKYDASNTIAAASRVLKEYNSTSKTETTFTGFLPYQYLNTLNTTNAITYLMCQSTGYKYSSNKELPAYTQAFSQLIPQSTYDSTSHADKPAASLKYPMFTDISFNNTTISYKLLMIDNIFGTKQAFTQKVYGTADSVLKYMKLNENSLYGSWTTVDTVLKTL